MITFAVNQQTGKKIAARQWRAWIQKIDRGLGGKRGEISIAVVGLADMRRLNLAYRGKNKATDVLSFAEKEARSSPVPWSKNYWGEIIICYPQAQKQAKQNRQSLNAELEWLLVHGTLHLLGYDHKQKKPASRMRQLEERILGRPVRL